MTSPATGWTDRLRTHAVAWITLGLILAAALVTGCAGFLGSNLVERLLGHGHRVVGIDNLSMGRLSNLEEIRRDPRFRFVEADVTDPAVMASVLR